MKKMMIMLSIIAMLTACGDKETKSTNQVVQMNEQVMEQIKPCTDQGYAPNDCITQMQQPQGGYAQGGYQQPQVQYVPQPVVQQNNGVADAIIGTVAGHAIANAMFGNNNNSGGYDRNQPNKTVINKTIINKTYVNGSQPGETKELPKVIQPQTEKPMMSNQAVQQIKPMNSAPVVSVPKSDFKPIQIRPSAPAPIVSASKSTSSFKPIQTRPSSSSFSSSRRK